MGEKASVTRVGSGVGAVAIEFGAVVLTASALAAILALLLADALDRAGWLELVDSAVFVSSASALALLWLAWRAHKPVEERGRSAFQVPLVACAIVLLSAGLASGFGVLNMSERDYSYKNLGWSRFFLRNMPPGPSLASTATLLKAIEAGNLEVIKFVIERGSREGFFELVGYDVKNAPCPRSLSELTLPAPQVRNYLAAMEEKFAIAEPGAHRRFSAALDDPASAWACLRTSGYRYYFNGPATADGEPRPGLIDAVRTREAALVERLITRGAGLEERDWMGRTPLMLALDQRNLSLARRLLERGADAAAVDKAGRSVAFYAARIGAADLVLRDADGKRFAGTTIAGETLLHAALAGGDLKLSRRLIKEGLPVGGKTAEGRTLMHYARGQLAVLMLLDLRLDPNARDASGRTPLHALIMDVLETARRSGRLPGAEAIEFETAQALIAAGADRGAADASGLTPAGWYATRPAAPASAQKTAQPAAVAADPWLALLQPK